MRTRVFRFRATSAALVSLGLFGCRDATQITVKVTNDFGCTKYGMQETGVVVSTLKRRQEYWDIKDKETADVPPLATRSSNCEELSTDPNSPLATIGELVIVPSGSRSGSVTFTIVGAWGPRQGTGTGGGTSAGGAGTSAGGAGTSAGGAGTSTVEPLSAEECMTVAGRNLEYTGQCDASENPACEPQVGCIWASRTVRFIPHTNVELTVPLRFDCSNVPCRGFETCEGGGCVPIPGPDGPPSATGGTTGASGAGNEPATGGTGGTGGVPAVGGTGGTASGGTGGTNTGGSAGDGIASKQSCAGSPNDCGADKNENCCASIAVAGGSFVRGTVAALELDTFEVTVRRYEKFNKMLDLRWSPPKGSGQVPGWPESGWNPAWNNQLNSLTTAMETQCLKLVYGSRSPEETATYPQACISWVKAFAFCIWDGGRLPTEAEWEAVASGGPLRLEYPWRQVGIGDVVLSSALTTSVGSSRRDRAVSGHADMGASLTEWVRDDYLLTPLNPCNGCLFLSPGSDKRMTRGGSYQSTSDELKTSTRSSMFYSDPSHRVGVRCAR
jgi:hypothetical protein